MGCPGIRICMCIHTPLTTYLLIFSLNTRPTHTHSKQTGATTDLVRVGWIRWGKGGQQ
jgi:hypothetical protein